MSVQRVLALARRIVRQFRRDRRTIFLMLVAPILILSLLSYIYRGSTQRVGLAVVNQGSSPLAAQIVAGLKSDASLDVREMDAAAAARALDRQEVDGVLTLPADLALRPAGPPQQIEVMLEGSQPNASGSVIRALNRTLPDIVIRTLSPSGLPIQLDPTFLHGGPQFDQLDYFAPTFIGFFAFFFVFLLTSVSFLRERIQGSIERLLVSPLTRAEIVVGYMLGFTLFAAIQSVVMVLFAVYVLNIHYNGSLLLLFFIVLLLTLGAVNLGIFLSTFARTELQVVQFIPMVITPQGLLSGIIWPIATLPKPLQYLAHLMPLTYANQALRGVMIRGDALGALWLEVLVLIGFAALVVVLAAWTLRREAL
jgi:ABC-2 type transport system permease protein